MTKVNRTSRQAAFLEQAPKEASESSASHPECNNQKRIERLTNLCMSTNELSLSSRSSCTPHQEFAVAEDSACLVQASNQPLALLRKISIETNNPQVVPPPYSYDTLVSYQPFITDCRNDQVSFGGPDFFPFERQLLLSSTLDSNLLNAGFDLEHPTTFREERGCDSE